MIDWALRLAQLLRPIPAQSLLLFKDLTVITQDEFEFIFGNSSLFRFLFLLNLNKKYF